MFFSELFLVISIFVLCLFLAHEDLRSAFVFLLLVSPLLHKEVFSLVRWDLLPIRIVMLSILFVCGVKFIFFVKKKKLSQMKEYINDPLLILLCLLWGIRLLSLINSKNLGASLLIFSFFTTMVFLYILIVYLSKKYKEKFVLTSIKFYSLVSLATAIIALLQFYLDYKYKIIFGALWRIPGKLSRVGSVFWDVNHYAGYISAMIPIVIGLMLASKTLFSRLFYAISALIMTIVLLLTNSRSAWIGFAAAITLIALRVFIQKFGSKKLLLVFTLIAVVFVYGLKEFNIKESVFREKIRSYFQYRGDSFASHFMLLTGAYQIFESHPVLGGGYGSFFEHFKDTPVAATYYARDPAALSGRVPAHSIWGEVLSETGFVGFTIFVLLVLFILGTVYYSSRVLESKNSIGESNMIFSFGSAIVAFLVSGIFYSYNAEFFFIILFLTFVYARLVLGEKYDPFIIFSYISQKKSFLGVLILLISTFLIFSDLERNHLIPWDEAIYAKVAKNMVKNKEYFTLFWDSSKPWFEKPPLYMWFSALLIHVFGVSGFSAKLPSAIFGLGTLGVVYMIGRRLFGGLTGFLAAISLVSTVYFLRYSRIGMLDVSTTFFIALALYFYYFSLDSKEGRFRFLAYILSGLSCGLAFMTKGVVGLLPVFVILASEIYLLITKEKKLNLKSYWHFIFFFLVAFLTIALPWHLWMFVKYKYTFLNSYFGYHVVKRVTESIEDKGQPFFWYLVVLRTSMRLWFPVLLGSLGAFGFSVLGKKVGENTKFKSAVFQLFKDYNSRNSVLILIQFLVIFSFFSISVSKIIWYITPLYVSASLLVSYTIVYFYEKVLFRIDPERRLGYKFILVFLTASFGLFYLFTVRQLAYLSNDTGAKARIIMEKDRLVGLSPKLFYDRIEKPLAVYYSDGEIQEIDYTPLVDEISDAGFGESIVFITKQSRFDKLQTKFSNITLLASDEELRLGIAKSEKQLLDEAIIDLKLKVDLIMDKSLEEGISLEEGRNLLNYQKNLDMLIKIREQKLSSFDESGDKQ
ncbi:MAG: glycosyltransferase family 39 protein [Patescibacteria group bacterium]